MNVTITAFERSPDRGRGLARDVRARWALEEAVRPYEGRLLPFEAGDASEARILTPGDKGLLAAAAAIGEEDNDPGLAPCRRLLTDPCFVAAVAGLESRAAEGDMPGNRE